MSRHWTRVLICGFASASLASGASCASAPVADGGLTARGAIPAVSGTPHSIGSLRVIDITAGDGTPYAPKKCIYTHYTGWLENGTKVDSSREPSANGAPAEPVSFVQGQKMVMDGWETGFEGMRVGSVRRLLVPWQLGYGARGNPPLIPPRSNLIFDVELMAVADPLPRSSGSFGPARCPAWSVVSRLR